MCMSHSARTHLFRAKLACCGIVFVTFAVVLKKGLWLPPGAFMQVDLGVQ